MYKAGYRERIQLPYSYHIEAYKDSAFFYSQYSDQYYATTALLYDNHMLLKDCIMLPRPDKSKSKG